MEAIAQPEVSVVVPMHNESANLPVTLARIAQALRLSGKSWEIIAVNDGSTDDTERKIQAFAREELNVRLVSYQPNHGRGYALRQGFAAARGEIICTTDADLSYGEEYLPAMVKVLQEHPEVDVVIGSPYMPGGKVEKVPKFREMISRAANKILGFALPGNLATVTGILRAYRRPSLEALGLESDGKEIHLEILSKAVAMGFGVAEMPATLWGRQKGKSKFKFRATSISHLLFSFFEKPMLLFGLVGLLLFSLAVLGGGYVIYLWQTGQLNPNRPLMTLIVILSLTGLQVLLFGFLGTQIVHLRREIYRLQRTTRVMAQSLGRQPAEPSVPGTDTKKIYAALPDYQSLSHSS